MPRMRKRMLTGNDYEPVCPWPDDVPYQWGDGGLVVDRKNPDKSYTTAFFEAFPDKRHDVGGFIRGEGETLKDAEEEAYSKFNKQRACTNHRWCRRGYKNGGTRCANCGAFRSTMKPIVILGEWKKPLTKWDMMNVAMRLDSLSGDPEDKLPYAREIRRSIRRDRLRARYNNQTEELERRIAEYD